MLCKVIILVFYTITSTLAYPYELMPRDNECSSNQHLQWTGGQFQFPCTSTKALLKSTGKLISKNILATRGQILNETLFLSLPRFRKGIPATLVKTNITDGSCSPILTPFPCWSMQEEGNCKALQSVVDVVMDPHNVLWVLDTGIVEVLEDPHYKCPPKVVAFDTVTGRVLKVISLEGLYIAASRLQYLVVDYTNDDACFVYISDAESRAIIVYSMEKDSGYRLILPRTVDTGCGKNRDVLYLALVSQPYGEKDLYFSYLCGKKMFSVSTNNLRTANADGQIIEVGSKLNKIVIIGTDNGHAIFFRNEGESEILRWDTTNPFGHSNIVYRGPTCQLATHAIPDYSLNNMRVLQSNFPDYFQNTVGCGAIQQLAVMKGCC